ncbi:MULTISPECIES: GGDEF domain-containing protein [Enterobacter]|uniref:GGDEF domain-containing protein n=1 Tax=Enterobacter TaxID=547 RepID=UPI0028F0CF10|nr:membrane-associated sensor domain-containing protein [Enterobacter cloacae]WNT34583.1 membrane-associated sensor domain-containing protein [Enterobacter cloacae]HDR2792682.1 membrane-associated sensor domain-containing protein [Enterobacter asburiae]HDR2797913.1 membrane-associated sensor domain-containing protein [Enterobacter asburiae]
MTTKKTCAAFDVRLAEMRAIAIKTSMTWFLWVNILFSLFLLGRRYFSTFDTLTTPLNPAGLLETMMVIDLTLSAGVLFILRMAPLQNASWLRNLAKGVVVGISLCWSVCFYVLIVSGDMRLIFPFAALLLFTALISLYFDPKVLLSFIAPVWLTILVTSLFHPSNLTVLNALLCILLAGMIESGRRILNSWFILALRREQENADLIQQLGQLASKDPLTGIANRRTFETRMDQEIIGHQRDGTEFGLIMLDVDHFKLYNDYYGHQGGDRCLMMIARVLESATQDSHGVVGRFGGEEFIVLLPDPGQLQSTAAAIANTLQSQAQAHALSPVSSLVTVSQGLATWKVGQTAQSVIARADKALYSAKQQGRNRWVLAQ